MTRQLRSEDYTVGWVCALPVELAAAEEMLDEEHETPQCGPHDTNIYTCGRIGEHNVVIACLPEGQMGTNSAAAVAVQMKSTFTSTRFGLMVGIGGGVPSKEVDVRLGDVVVSKPHTVHGGVVQYDFGKTNLNGFERTGSLNSPPTLLLNAVASLQAKHMRRKGRLLECFSKLNHLPEFGRDAAGLDVLFKAEYDHEGGATCEKCNQDNIVDRETRRQDVIVHYGTIASGNLVMKNASQRDKISAALGGVLCFEMEAAGLMNSFPCLVIRGICDYADSHKNKRWQAYASGTAAAYAKELLLTIPAADVMTSRPAEEATDDLIKRSSQHLPPDCTSSKRRKFDVLNSTENDISEERAITLPISHQKRSRTSLNDEQKHCLLESLRFEQIDARQMTIRPAHAKTCKWLLENPHYLNWLDATKLDEHHGFLWIKGKAGAGKSTLMKFAMTNARKMMKDYITLAFFFNARGEDMERSTIGTYRSLLLQLLERLPALQSVFDSLNLPTSSLSTDYRWNVESLKGLLEESIQALGETSVVCFIDALDECEEEQVRDMIQFFERVGDLAVTTGIRFQVCFSSRHYPHITIRNGLELVLEGQEGHSQDITNYVDTELKIGKSKTAQQVRVELQEKASGIFMWVVLVVGILNKASDRGQVHTLRRKLHEIPSDLHELFRDILTRDSDNRDGLVLCIQWVLFAKQPLSPEQLYYAILSGIDPNAVSQWDSDDITKDDIKRFILDSSKGLTEATMSKEQRIQFIHESVRDFLLKENGLGQIWPEFRSNFQGQSHEQLKQCCLNYISIDVSTPLGIPDDLPKANKPQAAALRKEAVQKFPFLEYAVQNILYHADMAEGSGISQAQFLADFSFPRWVKLDNLFKKHEVRRHKDCVTRLYVLAELNMANLKVSSLAEQCMEVENERYGCPLFAAAATGSEKTLELCLRSVSVDRFTENALRAVDERVSQYKQSQRAVRRDFVYTKTKGFLLCAEELGHDGVLAFLVESGRFEIDSKDSKGRTVLWWASKNGCETVARSLLLAGSTMINSKDKDNTTPLYVAAEKGSKAVVALLLDKSADVNAKGGYYGNALQAALANGHKEIVTVLLDKGADVDAQGGLYGNALQAASSKGFKEIVTVLLDKGADVNAKGGHYGNALYAASSEGFKEIVTVLLDKGVDVNAKGGHYYGNALHAALANDFKEIVTVLLDKGADVNAQGGLYGNALQAASSKGFKEIVTVLLDKGADVDAQGGLYGNALQAASANGHKEIVTVLLDKSVDVNAQGGLLGNALQAASVKGYKDIVTVLLDKGADVNAKGGEYGNAIYAASSKGFKEIVTVLLDKGADVNAKGGPLGNALQEASANGHKEIVTVLLDKSVDVNAQGGLYGNALQAASAKGYKDIVTVLLDKGADVNAQGGLYGNALYAASATGHKEIVTVLLDKGAGVNAKGGRYSSALQAASSNGHKEIVTLLRNRAYRGCI